MSNDTNRRRYRRVRAPVLCRPIGKQLLSLTKAPIDISRGGLRIFGDDAMAPGDRLEIELFLPDDTTLITEVEIVWVDKLPEGSPALFDMGLKFLNEKDAQLDRLAAVLEQDPAAGN